MLTKKLNLNNKSIAFNNLSLVLLLLLFAKLNVLRAADCPNSGTGWTTQLLNTAIDYKIHHKVVGSTTLHIRLDALSPTSGGNGSVLDLLSKILDI